MLCYVMGYDKEDGAFMVWYGMLWDMIKKMVPLWYGMVCYVMGYDEEDGAFLVHNTTLIS